MSDRIAVLCTVLGNGCAVSVQTFEALSKVENWISTGLSASNQVVVSFRISAPHEYYRHIIVFLLCYFRFIQKLTVLTENSHFMKLVFFLRSPGFRLCKYSMWVFITDCLGPSNISSGNAPVQFETSIQC